MTDRKSRGINQNIYLIDFDAQTEDKIKKKFTILGSTGKVYTVTIKDEPICTCPDFVTRHFRCKHIYFVLIRVMKVNKVNEDKAKFNKIDLIEMFDNMEKIANAVLLPENMKKNYNVTGLINASKNITVPMKKGELCPICLDDAENGELLDYCKYACGNPIHVQCFGMWIKNKKCAKCIICSANWKV